MKMKLAFFVSILATSLAAPALADNASRAEPLQEFSASDMQMLFEQNAMQLEVLSDKEMKETEGALMWIAPIAGWAAFGGVMNVGVNRWQTGSWDGSGRAFGAGATAGFYSSYLPVRVFGAAGSYALGAFGAASWYLP